MLKLTLNLLKPNFNGITVEKNSKRFQALKYFTKWKQNFLDVKSRINFYAKIKYLI